MTLTGPSSDETSEFPGKPGTRASRLAGLEAKGWHCRGFLPHFDVPGNIQFVTFRLRDSVPASQIEMWKSELGMRERISADDPKSVELRRRISLFEDAGKGDCLLRDERIATVVQGALLHFHLCRYRLLAWCIMPNHVHVLFEVFANQSLSTIVQGWKSFTAKTSNKLLRRTGHFWMEDYFDRFVRNDLQLISTVDYIEDNPVSAGLVARRDFWRWSSASPESSVWLLSREPDEGPQG